MTTKTNKPIDELEDVEIVETTNFKSVEEAQNYLKKHTQTPVSQYLKVPVDVQRLVGIEPAFVYSWIYRLSSFDLVLTNGMLSEKTGLSPRSITRCLKLLEEKGCIAIAYVTKSQRLIYPLFSLPTIYSTSSKVVESMYDNDSTGGFNIL